MSQTERVYNIIQNNNKYSDHHVQKPCNSKLGWSGQIWGHSIIKAKSDSQSNTFFLHVIVLMSLENDCPIFLRYLLPAHVMIFILFCVQALHIYHWLTALPISGTLFGPERPLMSHYSYHAIEHSSTGIPQLCSVPVNQ